MIEPALSDDAFLADVEAARAEDGLQLWWLGQSGFLVAVQGRALLLDPYLSDSLTRKYAGTERPHERLSARVVAPERLAFVDAVTTSHNHTDHLDAETLIPLLEANPELVIVAPEANRAFVAERLGVEPERLLGADDELTVEVAGLRITGIPAAHEGLERDELGRCRYLGYVVALDGWAVFHSGDTVLYEGMAERLRPYEIDVALLPINGREPSRGVAGNLNGREAARLAHEIGARLALPCHYDMFRFNTASPDPFARECRRLGQAHRILRAGERLTLDGES